MLEFRAFVLMVVFVSGILLSAAPVAASPLAQDDPVAQCAKGVELAGAQQFAEALPLLEAGFAGRDQATFAIPEELGLCALMLGLVRISGDDVAEALEPLSVAARIFHEAGSLEGEGSALMALGRVYQSQARYDRAMEAYQQALPLLREVGDRDTEAVIFSNIGVIYDDQGRYTEALEQYERALAIAREQGNKSAEGKALNNVGAVYQRQGRFAEALAYFEQALAKAREVEDRAFEGAALTNIGEMYRNQGRYAEALDSFQKALVLQRETGDRRMEGKTLGGIGVVYSFIGRYEEALDHVEQALHIAREVADRSGEGVAQNNLAEVYRRQGRYAEALNGYQRALAIYRELRNPADEAIALNNIGEIYDYQGRYAEALNGYQQSLEIKRKLGNESGKAVTMNNIGGIYQAQEDYALALEAHQEALAILRAADARTEVGSTLNSIASAYYYLGKYPEALDSYQQSLAIRREVKDREGEAATLNNIGEIYSKQERYSEALDALRQALAIEREIGDRDGEGLTLANLGAVYTAEGHYPEALEAFEQAMTIFEALRVVAGSEAGRASYIAQYAGLYDYAVLLNFGQRQYDTAFLTTERGRSRAFLDSLATGSVELSDDASAELLAREQQAYAARQSTQDALAKARSANPLEAAQVKELEAQLAKAEQEHEAAIKAISAAGGQLAALAPGRSGVLDLARVQALLDDKTTLVSYWVMDRGTLAFLVTHDDFGVTRLSDATPETLEKAVDSALSWANKEQAHPKPLRDLYTWLVAPIKDQLKTPKVVIVPHHKLHEAPFAGLSDGQGYFGEQHLLSVIPSASALAYIQQNAATSAATASTGAVVFGNPTTNDPKYPSLVHAAAEAQTVAEMFNVKAVTGGDASERLLRKTAAGSKVVHLAAHGSYDDVDPLASALHLAPDGQDAPGDGLLEAREVYGLDLKGNQLVTLSACQTNVGQRSRGDELVGLTRGFFFAGTPTILSSLWSVDDKATAALMTTFYRNWQAGKSKAEALQAAQAEVRANAQWASPYYWAGFVLNGDQGGSPAALNAQPDAPAASTAAEPVAQAAGSTGDVASEVAVAPVEEVQSASSPPWVLIVAGALAAVVVLMMLRRRRA